MDVEGGVRTIRKPDSNLEVAATIGKSDYSVQTLPQPLSQYFFSEYGTADKYKYNKT